jgi:adenine-specific DNA-methyltransferase
MLNQIITGDARELVKSIEDNSVSCIFTDPIYENTEDYRWLAEIAMRVLKPNSACLAFVSTRNAARCQLAMEDTGLTYAYTLNYAIPGKPGALHLYGLYPTTTPCLLFAKGRRKASPYLPDLIWSADHCDDKFEWSKNKKVLNRWMTSFTKPGDLIFDPFAGSGSIPVVAKETNRSFIGFEIVEKRANEARERLARTLTPLLLIEPIEQQERMAI